MYYMICTTKFTFHRKKISRADTKKKQRCSGNKNDLKVLGLQSRLRCKRMLYDRSILRDRGADDDVKTQTKHQFFVILKGHKLCLLNVPVSFPYSYTDTYPYTDPSAQSHFFTLFTSLSRDDLGECPILGTSQQFWEYATGIFATGLQVILFVEYTGPPVILAPVFNGATGFLCISNHGAIDYFLNFCCETIVKSRGSCQIFEQLGYGAAINL